MHRDCLMGSGMHFPAKPVDSEEDSNTPGTSCSELMQTFLLLVSFITGRFAKPLWDGETILCL